MSFHNTLLTKEECIHRMSKQTKMCSSESENSCKNLLMDVPIEILQVYSKFLDLKSSVMFNKVCKRTYDKANIKKSEFNTLLKMFSSVSYMIKDLYDLFGTIESQNKLLAGILRRLIYTSMFNNMYFQNDISYVTAKTLDEYHEILRLTMESMDYNLSMFEFNNLLEDVQFEFRGYSILNLTKQKREQLEKLKSIIREHYFSHDFTIYTYTTFGNVFIEFQCNKDNIMVDIHERLNDEIFSWSFLTDTLKAYNDSNSDNDIFNMMKDNEMEIVDNMISWKKGNTKGIYVFTEIVKLLIDCSSIYKGSDDNIVEVWNDTIDTNWLLKEVTDDILSSGLYQMILKNITNSVQDDFYSYDIYEAMLIL